MRIGELRRSIAIVAQDPFLFSTSVRENISFGAPDATDEEIETAARMAQAHDFIAALPDAYDTVIGERGVTLSGGQRQRIAIARAIVMNPRVLILDDATASVDATTEAQIRLGLREAMKGRTTLIVAHRLSTISLADELVVLDHGRIVERGQRGRALRDERGLPPDRLARTRPGAAGDRAGGGDRVRVHQAGSHLMDPRGVKVDDWSWSQTVRRMSVLVRLTKPYRAKTILAIASLLAATADGARPALPREGRDRPGHRGGRHADAHAGS